LKKSCRGSNCVQKFGPFEKNGVIAIFFGATFIGNFPFIVYIFMILTKIPVPYEHCLRFNRTWKIFHYASPAINAIIYSFLGKRFRKDLTVFILYKKLESKILLTSFLEGPKLLYKHLTS